MKKSFIAMAALSMLLSGCHKEESGNRNGEKVKLTANLSQGEVTKADVEPGDKGADVYWTNGDNISVFGKPRNINSYLGKITTTLAERSKKATFEGEVTRSLDNSYYVFYPYNSAHSANNGTSIPLNLETQNGKVDDFTWMSNYMYMFGKEPGQMDNNNQMNFSMGHVCALLQFEVKLKGAKEGVKLKSIAVSGDNIKSKKTLDIYNKTTEDVTDSGNKITLSYPSGGAVLGTDGVTALMSTFPAQSGKVDVSVTVDNNGTEQTVAITGVTIAFEAGKRYTKELELDLPEPEETDVYVAGYEMNSSGTNVVKVWKNGKEEHVLTDGTQNAFAYSVYVSGSDVYVAGYEANSSGTTVAKVWKNGKEEHALTDGTLEAFAYSVYASGSDVYAAGYEMNSSNKTVAKVWKNGKEEHVLTDGTLEAFANSVYVSGSDVYVAGYEMNSSRKNVAKVWKNGKEEHVLTDGTLDAYANSVYVSGSDVYVAGSGMNSSNKSVAKVWKNGKEFSVLTDGTQAAYARSIYVSGSDVYVAGYERNSSFKNIAKVWKNGEVLSVLTDGTQNAYAYSVYVSGSDVYVAGYGMNSSNKTVAKVWKNGKEEHVLTDGTQNAQALSVFCAK